VDYADRGALGLGARRREESFFAPLIKSYEWIVRKIPCEKTIRRIHLRFDKSTASFFTACYFILKFAGFSLLLFTPLLIAQGSRLSERESDGDESIDFSTVCSVVPCFILYSKMDSTVQSLYSWTLLLFLLFGIIGFARKYTVFAA
jgi:hypothetical protein